MRAIASVIRAARSLYPGNSKPSGRSLMPSPVPTPRAKRPADRRSTVAAACATSPGW